MFQNNSQNNPFFNLFQGNSGGNDFTDQWLSAFNNFNPNNNNNMMDLSKFFGNQNNNPFDVFNQSQNSYLNQDNMFKTFTEAGNLDMFINTFAQNIKTALKSNLMNQNMNFFKTIEEPVYKLFESFNKNPTIQGPFKEASNEFQEFIKSFFSIIETKNHLINAIKQTADEAIDIFLKRAKSEDKVESLQKLYFLWSKTYDEVFEKNYKKESYAKSQSDFTNAIIKVRTNYKRIQSKLLKLYHIPTEDEVDSVNKKLHELSRTVKSLQMQLDEMKSNKTNQTTTTDKKRTPTKTVKKTSKKTLNSNPVQGNKK